MMRRKDTAEEAAFRAEIRAWLEAHAELRRSEGDESSLSNTSTGPRDHTPQAEALYFERCRRWQQQKFDAGWAGITWPEAYGGRGGSAAESLIFSQEEAAFDVTSGFLPSTIALVGPALMRHGNEAQRERYLRPLLRGDKVWCQLFSEPEAGSDLAALRTRAVLEGDTFVVNGQKLWTTNAQFCDFGILLVRTNPDVVKHAGITFLLVDMKAPGIEVRPLPTIKGDRHFNEVFFTDVRVPAQNVVGEIDAGWSVAKTTLANESVMIGSGRQSQGDIATLVRAARESGQWNDPLVRQQVAEVYIEERILGFLQDRLQDAILAARMPDVDGSVLKVLWAEGRSRKAYMGLGLQGPAGMLAGNDAVSNGYWQEQVLDRSMGTIGGGTVEVHRNGIGERVLGLPKEPRVDRDVPFRDLDSSGK